jgi:hypothetical protein
MSVFIHAAAPFELIQAIGAGRRKAHYIISTGVSMFFSPYVGLAQAQAAAKLIISQCAHHVYKLS